MRLDATLRRLGFTPGQLYYTLRTATGACLALWLAWAAGLEHPQWAAMSVWIASQPTRGMLLEKSLFRALGTLVGAVFGVALVALSGNQPWALVLGLAVWVSVCAGMGSVWRGMPPMARFWRAIRRRWWRCWAPATPTRLFRWAWTAFSR